MFDARARETSGQEDIFTFIRILLLAQVVLRLAGITLSAHRQPSYDLGRADRSKIGKRQAD